MKKRPTAHIPLSEFRTGNEPSDLRKAGIIKVEMTPAEALTLFRLVCLTRALSFLYATEPTGEAYSATKEIEFKAIELLEKL